MARTDTERIGVAIMARAPVLGKAKTRLIPALGAEGAANLQRWLMQRTVAMALVADVGPVSLWCAGDQMHPDFRLCQAYGPVSLHAQPEGSLGHRMLAAARGAATEAVILIGTDCPVLTAGLLREAVAALTTQDAVIFPAEDGGYVLIGMRFPHPALFSDIDWGSEHVMTQTRRRLAALGWRWTEPVTLWDVDRPADYERLAVSIGDVRQVVLI
ncbi:MAG: hypothetical protein CVU17_06890 [Betaproteobacteria bacterium HGW-Betaproteobacteria-11]|nr:MAG: hypothetical protein CVU17_06890 [Betaproteobacteria bacterium HGW-Betaproteobacteria-11]